MCTELWGAKVTSRYVPVIASVPPWKRIKRGWREKLDFLTRCLSFKDARPPWAAFKHYNLKILPIQLVEGQLGVFILNRLHQPSLRGANGFHWCRWSAIVDVWHMVEDNNEGWANTADAVTNRMEAAWCWSVLYCLVAAWANYHSTQQFSIIKQ